MRRKIKIHKNIGFKKLQELMLYIARLSQDDSNFGSIKLNKLLFYCDFVAFREFNKAITEDEYQALEWGPAPEHLKPVREKMIAKGDAVIQKVKFFGHPQQRLVALREPDLDIFTKKEIELINEIVSHFRNFNGDEISGVSHKFIGWEVANIGDIIPKEVALIHLRQLSIEERKYGASLEPLAKQCIRNAC